jgi:type IV secretion system protein VirB10
MSDTTLGDPRPAPAEGGAFERPAVASAAGTRGGWLILGAAVLMGVVVLAVLVTRRTAEPPRGRAETAEAVTAPATPADIASFSAAGGASPAQTPAVALVTPPAPTVPFASPPAPPPPGSAATDSSLKAPAVVVDLASEPGASAPRPAAAATPGAPVAGGAAPAGLNGDEQFARRVGAEEPEHAEATVLHNLGTTVPQGAMIPAVLETALDSDLPGYARAVVSRDVRGFDGSAVLIPQGSRVIGQYKSAVAQGQSRVFVIWTRILRPDGASIQIASSGTDPLGRAGLAGSVNRHFLEEFSGSVLLSVINAGIASIAHNPGTEIVIGSAQQATTLAGSAFSPASIPPTIKVPQGAPIRIFVARDLDFTAAGGVGR